MFLAPADDLPAAMVGSYRIAFTRNGAFIVSSGGRWLFDGGLQYATADPSEWGTQIRRFGAKDASRLDEKNDRLMVTDGTLLDNNGAPRFRFTQRTKIIPGGLSLSYEIMSLEKRPLREFGIALHVPAAESNDCQASFWPGFLDASLPRRFDPSVRQEADGRACVFQVWSGSRGAVVGHRVLAWKVGDDRESQPNVYALTGRDDALAAQLAEGKTVTFSFDVLLGNAAARTVSLDEGYCDVDRYGRLVVRDFPYKFIEGGLMLPGSPIRWLCAKSDPDYENPQTGNERAVAASGIVDVNAHKCDYEVKLSALERGVLAVYRVRPVQAETAEDNTPDFQVGFAVLRRGGAAPPTLNMPASPGPDPLPGTHEAYAAILDCTGETTVEMRSDNPWTLSEARCDGGDCFVLSTRMRKMEGGAYEAPIRISTHHTRPSVE